MTGNIILPIWESILSFITKVMGMAGGGSVAESRELELQQQRVFKRLPNLSKKS